MTDPRDHAEPATTLPPDVAGWRDPGFDVAWRILRDRGEAAAIVRSVLESTGRVEDEDVGTTVLTGVRRAALRRLAESGERPGAGGHDTGLVFVHQVGAPGDAVAEAELAWGTAEAVGPADASLIDLHLRFDVPATALATDLGASDPSEASARLDRLAGRVEGALGSWILWNRGHPKCDALAAEVSRAGSPWGPVSASRIARHAVGCEHCRRTLDEERVTAERFAEAPVLRAPTARRDDAPVEHAPGPDRADPGGREDDDEDRGDHGGDHDEEDSGEHGDEDDHWSDGDDEDGSDWDHEDEDDDEDDDEHDDHRSGSPRRYLVVLVALVVVVLVILAYVLLTAPEAGEAASPAPPVHQLPDAAA